MKQSDRKTGLDKREETVARKTNLIVALDFPEKNAALSLFELLFPDVKFFKVGIELFVSSGPGVVREITSRGGHVFLDLKFNDIPNSVRGAVACATHLGVDIISIHLSAGRECLAAAREAVEEASRASGVRPVLAGVTVLTSLAGQEGTSSPVPVLQRVVELASLARDCGLDGIITSVQEAGVVRSELGPEIVIITPGIRLSRAEHDHKRVGTVADAVAAGVDYLVVGRPITQASDPREEALKFLGEISRSAATP